MNKSDLVRIRLANLQLAATRFNKPAELVHWMGAIQAQDYNGALWALGLRLPNTTSAEIEQAIARGEILRTWPLRGTIHFVTPEDVRWLLALSHMPTMTKMRRQHTLLEIDRRTLHRSREVCLRALEHGKALTRPELYRAMEAARISTANQRGLHILGTLALQGVICIGPKAGKQPTFVLLETMAPKIKLPDRIESLAELARRYFTSHGPATVQDYGWWSGLPAADVRAGLQAVQAELDSAQVENKTYWFVPPGSALPPVPPLLLLPPYDEYTVAYRDRSAVLDPAFLEQARYGIFDPTIAVKGEIVGTWKRVIAAGKITVQTKLLTGRAKPPAHALTKAAKRYAAFFGHTPVED